MKISKGEQTRLRILEAATELAFQKGFHSLTFGEIAAQAGLTQPGIYNYFPNVEAVIIAGCQHWVSEAQAWIDAKTPALSTPKEQLMAMIEQNYRYSHANRKKDALLIALYYCAMSSREAMKIYAEITDAGVRRLQQILLAGQREGVWITDGALEMARTIHAFLVGGIIKMIIRPRELALEERIIECRRTVETLLKVR